MPVIIGEARPEDAPAIAELSSELGDVLRSVGNPVGASLDPERVLRDGFGADAAFGILVARLDGDVVGYLLHHPAYDPDLGGRVTSVVDLCVAGSFRRRGVGRMLMAAALDRCRRAGGSALVWWVRSANREAVAFYRALGASGTPDLLSMHWPAS